MDEKFRDKTKGLEKLAGKATQGKWELTSADLVENFTNFQPYALSFREKSKFFRLLLRGRPGMGARAF